ncbi:hypothetical protein E2C06_19530 [Dankookia rubra]|uniref:Uncharacterized protein n=1 Tax=Dankookia rubra TaxID=1442381 RepID=A0A4R5QE41_9PROT|nr:hypothetical protein [Dankookia rubra]TDH60929.1 hypothetical protein E2C06_19530 [Dankookia rubra]
MMHKLSPVLALGALLGLAQAAAAHEMQVLQGGESFEVRWTGGARDNLAGGGIATLQGGGDDGSATYAPRSTQGQSAFATLQGGGDDRTLTRSPAEARASMLAQRDIAPSRR